MIKKFIWFLILLQTRDDTPAVFDLINTSIRGMLTRVYDSSYKHVVSFQGHPYTRPDKGHVTLERTEYTLVAS